MSMSKTLYTRKCSKITTDLIKEEHELQKDRGIIGRRQP